MAREAAQPSGGDRHRRLGIPRSFKLHGHRVTVRIIAPARWRHGVKCLGYWQPNTHRIDLRSDLGDTELQQAFCHELTHALLDELNHPLSHDEVFVDNLGSLLHQALSTFDSNPKG